MRVLKLASSTLIASKTTFVEHFFLFLKKNMQKLGDLHLNPARVAFFQK
jgi:hypothetical protein